MAKLLKTSLEDIEFSFQKLDEFCPALVALRRETMNEPQLEERIAYIQGYNYLTERNKLLKELRIAKQENDQVKIQELKEKRKKQMELIDDTMFNNLIDKPLNELTEEEQDAIIKFRIKYGISKRRLGKIFHHTRESILKLEQRFVEKYPLYRDKLEILNYRYDQEKLQNFRGR